MQRIFRHVIDVALAVIALSLPATSQAEPFSAADGPSIYDTVPIQVKHNPYQNQWDRVVHSASRSNPISEFARNLSSVQRVSYVNKAVNDAIAYKDDAVNWRTGDHWATASETLLRGSGDCEDFAILKMQLLSAAGISANDMYLVVGNDLVARTAHAILVVRVDGGLWTLDNRNDEIHLANNDPDFRPLVSLSAGKAWAHGYKANIDMGSDRGTDNISPINKSSKLAAMIAAQSSGVSVKL
ncbi:transglutaminase-like cysteine peptidase [Croceicoccus ponticola]|uniref:transglutaminase-like cysteine peptidase n=1 Tax=Croceicoccus ponticola TaxID=2217664 RepID=UPI0013E35A97|nr:transglutaminase-like cysteine peptidase [Croceicoccus ponticola]